MLGAALLAISSTYTPTFTMTGGTETTFVSSIDGYTYKVHTFTGWAQPLVVSGTNVSVDTLFVGAGGDGGGMTTSTSGVIGATGGGAGGVIYINYSLTTLSSGTYAVYVSNNGSPERPRIELNGSAVLSGQIGGAGGGLTGVNGTISNTPGDSAGGGGAATNVTGTKAISVPNYQGGQGYPSATASARRGGGGSGGGWSISPQNPNDGTLPGKTATVSIAGSGGNGATIPAGLFASTTLYYSPGGGGGAGTSGNVGLAGGTGAGAGSSTLTGNPGLANTGGGGGGIYGTISSSVAYTGGQGGSGIIKIRYRIA